VALFIGAFGSRRSAQEVEGVSISNRGLNHVLVWIHGNLMKNMLGKKSPSMVKAPGQRR
jgi:hypothetical protein